MPHFLEMRYLVENVVNDIRRRSTVLKEKMSEGLRAEQAPSDPRPRGRRRSSSNDVLTECLISKKVKKVIFDRMIFNRLTLHHIIVTKRKQFFLDNI